MHKDLEDIEGFSRFEFGKNWNRFLKVLNEERIALAEKSLKTRLGVEDLNGRSFLDVGSGSGLFSLAARRLGASVHSFDYDPQSVACTAELKRRYFQDDPQWAVNVGSVLDIEYLNGLKKFDIVYSWGVLHHTGDMWQALENAVNLVNVHGKLFISIYNDQGSMSHYWRKIKRLYNVGVIERFLIITAHLPYLYVGRVIYRAVTGRQNLKRGMSIWYDMKDWLGGSPFEVAKPEWVIDYCSKRGFVLTQLGTCGGRSGCNEFVFSKVNSIERCQ